MNDPQVVALIYSIEHSSSVDYSNEPPFDHEEKAFKIKVEGKQVRFELREHHASVEAAQETVEPYIRGWELDAGLRRRPGDFMLNFDRPEIVDRNPTAGVTSFSFHFRGGVPTVSVSPTVTKPYPQPPAGLTLDPYDPDVQTMYKRYEGYCQNREPLTSMAYFCLTMLESHLCRGRENVAREYEIDREVLSLVGNLTANRGGRMARKASGIKDELTPQESHFLEEATKAMIRRVAEVVHDPQKHYPKIKRSHLPSAVGQGCPGSRGPDGRPLLHPPGAPAR